MNTYQVIVSNVGTLYDGPNEAEAQAVYKQASEGSHNVIGRGAGEDVTLIYKGEPSIEYIGVLNTGARPAETTRHTFAQDDKAVCACPKCTAKRMGGTALGAHLTYALVTRIEEEANREEDKAAHKDGALGYTIDLFIEHLPTIEGIGLEQADKPALYDAIMTAIATYTSGG